MRNDKIDIAKQVSFAPVGNHILMEKEEEWAKKLIGYTITKGNIIKFRNGNGIIKFIVLNHTPEPGLVKITEYTKVFLQEEDFEMRLRRLRKEYDEREK